MEKQGIGGERTGGDEVLEGRGKERGRYCPRRQWRTGRRSRTARENARRRKKHAVEEPGPGLHIVRSWQAGDGRRTLRPRDKEERECVPVVEDSVAGADNRLRVRRIRKSDSGLERAIIGIYEGAESRIKVPAQAVIHG